MKGENGERFNELENNRQGFVISLLKQIFGDEYVETML
jgi:hypothetical protein